MSIYSQPAYLGAALACAIIASITDLRSRRIPNRLTGPAMLFGLLVHLTFGGPAQLGLSLLAGLIGGGAFLLFFMAGGMGGGDVKLMAAVGCLAGMAYIKDILLSTVLVGAAMAVGLAFYRGKLRETVANVWSIVRHHGSEGLMSHPELNLTNSSTLRLPYALPIAAGCLVALLLASGGGVR